MKKDQNHPALYIHLLSFFSGVILIHQAHVGLIKKKKTKAQISKSFSGSLEKEALHYLNNTNISSQQSLAGHYISWECILAPNTWGIAQYIASTQRIFAKPIG